MIDNHLYSKFSSWVEWGGAEWGGLRLVGVSIYYMIVIQQYGFPCIFAYYTSWIPKVNLSPTQIQLTISYEMWCIIITLDYNLQSAKRLISELI